MHIHSKLAAVTLALTAITVSTPVVAKVPIPCTGDKSFKIAESGFKRKDGTIVYLGYRYTGCFNGEWIGYIDNRRYVTLPDEQAALVLAAAGGMKTLPEPPNQLAHPGKFWIEWLWTAIIAFIVIGTVTSSVAANATARDRRPTA